MPGPCKQQPGEPWMSRKPDKLPPQRRDRGLAPRNLDPPEHHEESQRLVNRLGLGGVEPGKSLGLPEGEKLEKWAGEIGAEDLGDVGGGAVLVRRFVPQPEADTGAGAPRAAGPLVGRRPRNRDQFEPRQPRRTRNTHLTDHPRIDDRADARDRQARLSDVRRQDDLPSAGLLENAVLLFRWQLAMKDDDRVPVPVGERIDCVGRSHDLADAREEDEHVAG